MLALVLRHQHSSLVREMSLVANVAHLYQTRRSSATKKIEFENFYLSVHFLKMLSYYVIFLFKFLPYFSEVLILFNLNNCRIFQTV